VLHIQGSGTGDSCCVNLAIHFTFLPTELDDSAHPKSIREPDCEFRRRLALENESDHWWHYGSTDADSARSVDHLVLTFQRFGIPHFDRYREFPGVFANVTPEMLKRADMSLLPGRTTIARAALTMARISVFRKQVDLANVFVDVGLAELNQNQAYGAGVRRRLDELRKSLETGRG